jgi:hypothetical protein
MDRTCVFYAVGKSNFELRAYDEYDSQGSGLYWTDDLLMIERYTHIEALKEAFELKVAMYIVEIKCDNKVYSTDVKLMYDENEVQEQVQNDKIYQG